MCIISYEEKIGNELLVIYPEEYVYSNRLREFVKINKEKAEQHFKKQKEYMKISNFLVFIWFQLAEKPKEVIVL